MDADGFSLTYLITLTGAFDVWAGLLDTVQVPLVWLIRTIFTSIDAPKKANQMTSAATHIQIITDSIERLMSGQGLPSASSEEFQALTETIRAFVATATTNDHAALGHRVLSLLVDAGRAQVEADRALLMSRKGEQE